MSSAAQNYDVAVIGGGHNALVSATLLARAGLSVVVLERLPRTGGAAVSATPWPGTSARLSRYSYLVSLMPESLMADLDLDVRLAERSVASFTPWRSEGVNSGLLVEGTPGHLTRRSFLELTGSPHDHWAWREFYDQMAHLAQVVAPTLTEPLPRSEAIAAQVDPTLWQDLTAAPIGAAIRRRFRDDTVRGVVATDALIGTFASLEDPSLVQNRCLLYHLIGNGTGDWRVPVGGMGALTDALRAAATRAGAEILTDAEVSGVHAFDVGAEVTWHRTVSPATPPRHTSHPAPEHRLSAGFVLSGVAPWTLSALMGVPESASERPEGAQVKVNLLLDRLPALRSGVDPAVAFAGTLHLNEGYANLERAHQQADAGTLPTHLPVEIYCHTLSDRTILGPEAPASQQTLTMFGLHTPARLFEAEPDLARARAVAAAMASLQEHLAEPLWDCLAHDEAGNPCIEAKIPQDVEADLAMPGGHIFHGDLAWPWATRRADLTTPAARWGVATSAPSVLFCGSGAQRGGAVSGIGGHNAAQAVLESI